MELRFPECFKDHVFLYNYINLMEIYIFITIFFIYKIKLFRMKFLNLLKKFYGTWNITDIFSL